MDGFDTIEEAIQAAAIATRKTFGNKEEAITVIFEQDGKFFFTDPGSIDPDSNRTKAKFTIPKDSLRFIVHNHPAGKENQFFSTDDIEMSERLGVSSAIIFGDEKPIIRTFTPGKSEIRKSRFEGDKSLGDEFIFPKVETMRKQHIKGLLEQ